MDVQTLVEAATAKAELDRMEELTRVLRTASLHPNAADPGSENVFAVAAETEQFLSATSDTSHADRLRGQIATAVDTALALPSQRLRIRLLRAGVRV